MIERHDPDGGIQQTQIVDGYGNPVSVTGNKLDVNATIATTGLAQETTLQAVAGLVLDHYDYISIGYTGSNATSIVYKHGGSAGTTVATLALVYDGSDNLLSVTKT